jgi:hypothetical protein
MSRVGIWDLLFFIIIVAILFSLVRPGSRSGEAIVVLTDALAVTVGLATGYTKKGST